MSLLLQQKKEQSYKNYKTYVDKIVTIMNKSGTRISPQLSLRTLFTIGDIKPSFPPNSKVYKLYSPFERKGLKYKQSIFLGKNPPPPSYLAIVTKKYFFRNKY